MSWRDQLQDASFRGVSFLIDGHETDFGRRVVVHEYPFQDLPETEDLGQRATRFSLNAYVLGPDYFPVRDQLYDALNQAGAGTLVHPYLGRVQVVVLDVRLTETTRQGGVARFDVRFIQASTVTRPTAVVNTQAAVLASSTAAQIVADQGFQDNYSLTAAGVGDAVSNALDTVFAGIENNIGNALSLSTVGQQLVELPGQIAARIDGDLRELGSIASLQKFFTYGAPSAPASLNYDNPQPTIAALALHVQTTALLAAAELTAQTDYASYNDAIAGRDVILDQIDTLSQIADADLYASLQDLRVQVATDIAARSANLAIITSYTPAETAPALAIAQRLYGPIGLEANLTDILARNQIANPLFVTGGQALEVLSD